MTETLGHFGMALVFLAPAWYFIDDWRTAVVVVGTGFWFGPVPDLDTYLADWFPNSVHHHGVVHTLLAVVIMTAILGPALGWALERVFGGTKWFSEAATEKATRVGVIAVGAALVSHIAADMLSAPDIASQIEPLWPVVQGPVIAVDVLYYDSIWATVGLFVVGLAANASVAYWTTTRTHQSV